MRRASARLQRFWIRLKRLRAAQIRNYLHYTLLRSRSFRRLFRPGIRPAELFIEGTNICNARCAFCAYPQMERPKVTMPMDTFRSVVDQYLKLGFHEVDLTPIVGDPFVDKFLFERLDYLSARRERLGFHFYTNAILMKPALMPRLAAYGERLTIYCSFGGFDRETYHAIMGVDKFHEAVANIRDLIETKVRTGSRINIGVNLRVPVGTERGPFWEYLLGRQAAGVVRIHGVEDYENWGGKITDDALRAVGLVPKPPAPREGVCYRLVTGPTVLADGRVNACCCRDVEASLIIGDARKTPLIEIFSGPEIRALIDRHERGDFPDVCKTCTQYGPLEPLFGRTTIW